MYEEAVTANRKSLSLMVWAVGLALELPPDRKRRFTPKL